MEELDLRDIVQILLKHVWIIIAFSIIAALLTGIISVFFLDDIFSASTTLIVSKQTNGSSYNELQLSDVNLARNLVSTYTVIVKSNRVMDKVLSDLDLDLTVNNLRDKISVSPENNTEIIRISVEDTDPNRARDIANSTAAIFMNEVKTLLKMDNVQVIDEAKTPKNPVKPRVLMNIAIATVLGLMLGVFIAFLIEYLDNTIKTSDDVEKYLGLPVLGIIPNFDE